MSKSVPPGRHSVTPRLVVHEPAGLVEFRKNAFGATGEDRPTIMTIGDSLVMISSVGPRDAMRAFLYLYVDDADMTYVRWKPAPYRSNSRGTLPTAIGERWSRIRPATFGKSQPIKVQSDRTLRSMMR
jgi:hypothetical protein